MRKAFKYPAAFILPGFCALLLTLCGIPQAGAALLPQFVSTLYNSGSGLPTNEINTVIQTADGYIWLGSGAGLLRFNGISFETAADIDTAGFGSASVTALLEDKNGTLWIGTEDKGLFSYKNGSFTRLESGGLFSDSIRTLTLAADGGVIAGSSKGCAKVLAGGAQEICGELADVAAASVSLTPGGSLWIVSDSGGIIQVFGSSVVFEAESARFSDFKCISVLAYDDSSVLFGTEGNALISLDTSDSSYEAKLVNTENISGAGRILRDSAGRIWLCADSGIALYENGRAERLDTPLSLFCTGFFEDYEGGLWFSSSRHGLLRLSPSKFTNPQTGDAAVRSAAVHGTLLYAATDRGLLILDTQNNYTRVENALTELLDGIALNAAFTDSKNRLWLCASEKYGAVCYDGSDWIIYNEKAGLAADSASVLCALADGSMAIASGGSISILTDGKITKTYTEADGLICTNILSLSQDGEGALWAGTEENGLYKIKDGKISNLTVKNGLASDCVPALHYDSAQGILWVSALSRLCAISADGTISVLTSPGNKSNIYDIIPAPDGKLWILTSTEVIISDAESLLGEKTPEIRRLGNAEGLISNITSYSYGTITQSTLYIPCYTGISIIDTENIPLSPAPKIAVNAVVVDGERYDPSELIILKRKANRIVIEYALLSFTGKPGTVSYILDGHDAGYSELSGATSITYTNLGGGIYTFRIYGTNGDGVRSDSELDIRISKEYSWYEIPYVWFALAIITVIIVITALNKYLALQTDSMSKSQEKMRVITDQAITAIARTIDAKEEYGEGHSRRVARYAAEIARRMGLSPEEQTQIYYGGLLHDIGKINLPEGILNKPGKLTEEEIALIKKYPERGGDLLKTITKMPFISEGARYHHEKFDGSGYAHGLKGDEIPLAGRIICAADAFDAMSSDRPFRSAKTRGEIAAEFVQCSGTQFEPHIADIVINMINDGFEVK